MTVIVAYCTNAALILMIYMGELINQRTYAGLARSAMGVTGEILVTGAVLANGLGTMITYLILIGSEIPKLASIYLSDNSQTAECDLLLCNRTFIVITLSLLFILPLLFWKSIGKLKHFSIIGVLCVPVIIMTVFYRSFINPSPVVHRNDVHFGFFGDKIFPSIAVMSFAFVSNQNAFLNYSALKTRSVGRWVKSTFMGVTASLLISLSLAVVGFVAFGNHLTANILTAFPADDPYINFASLVLAISMFVSYPMQFYPSRVALLTLMGEKSGVAKNRVVHVTLTLLLFTVTVVVAVLVEDLGTVYQLVGAICSSMIAFLLPAASTLFIMKRMDIGDGSAETEALLRPPNTDSKLESHRQRHNFSIKAFSAFLLAFGLMVLVAGTGQTLLEIVK